MRPFVTPPLSVHHNPRIQIAAFCSLGEGFPLARRWPAIDLVAASRLTHAHTHHTSCSGDGSSAAIIIMSLQPASAARRACVAAIATTTIDEEGANVKGPSMLLFSGGTAFNGVVEELKKFTTRVAHVLPVSDNGGSTAEIVRVLGGPAVGDIRSRCLRLSSESSVEALAVKRLLGHRLSLEEHKAKTKWYEIVEGDHELWRNVSGPYRETIRAFLVHFQSQILQHSRARFHFANGSIGNFFFAGARIFFQSLDAAIFLYSRVSHIPIDSLVLPAICTNDRLTLGCELKNGMVIRGQNEISHPMPKDAALGQTQAVNKASPPLPSPIKRIFYMSSEGTNLLHEVFPVVNSTVLEQLIQVDAVVYGIGSLYTSICPSLVPCGVGEAIAVRSCPKILILNTTHDRETAGMTASAFVVSICDALNRKYCNDPCLSLQHKPSAYISVMLVPAGGEIPVDMETLTGMGINHVVTVGTVEEERLGRIYKPKALIAALQCVTTNYHSHDLDDNGLTC
ncbi:unnamed protein product [Sphagnum troendelagicum]|uniref:Maternal effect embryo arrest 18 n=1 Tax=Sphagnum troendelagicum TaxID=128251 RepID=A0ABP0TCI0_9BRYO